MSKPEHIRDMINKLKQGISKDPVRTEYHDMTALSLVELTRMKIREPLEVQIRNALRYREDENG